MPVPEEEMLDSAEETAETASGVALDDTQDTVEVEAVAVRAAVENEVWHTEPDVGLSVETGELTESEDGEANAERADVGRTIPLAPLPDEMLATLVSSSRSQTAVERVTVIRAVQRCHVGLVRARNEDSSYIFSTDTGGQEPLMPFGLFIVADGMGGHYAGHEASKNVSRLVGKQVLERIYLPLLQNSTNMPGVPPEPIQEVMLEAVQAADQAIHNPDPEKDGGTTLTAALILGRRLYVAHVGDSRAYLFSNDELKQVTIDHSYVRRLQETGQITEEEAASHPQRNMLYMAVGQGGMLDVDTFTQALPRQGKLMLCSDGLWGLVPEPVLKEHLDKNISLQETADELVKLALIAGAYDNITVVLVDFAL